MRWMNEWMKINSNRWLDEFKEATAFFSLIDSMVWVWVGKAAYSLNKEGLCYNKIIISFLPFSICQFPRSSVKIPIISAFVPIYHMSISLLSNVAALIPICDGSLALHKRSEQKIMLFITQMMSHTKMLNMELLIFVEFHAHV